MSAERGGGGRGEGHCETRVDSLMKAKMDEQTGT